MKTTPLVVLLSAAVTASGQVGITNILAPTQSLSSSRAIDGFTTEFGPDHQLLVSTPSGGTPSKTSSRVQNRVVAIGTGMHFWDGQQWSPSEPAFESNEDGSAFVAKRVQHRAQLNAELNTAGAVTLELPGLNTFLQSSPVAIGLYDPVTGNSQVIASITNSLGQLIDTNMVLYAGALKGPGVCADILYTIDQSTFHQDVLFTGYLDVTAWGFPTNALLQVITELYAPPNPAITRQPLHVEPNPTVRNRMVSPDLLDDTLTFGNIVIGPGQAYAMPSASETNGASSLVGKDIKTLNGRVFLFESVRFEDIQNGLLSLPQCDPPEHGFIRNTSTKGMYAAIPKPALKTSIRSASASTKPIPFARSAFHARRAYAIDYTATLTSGTTTLQGDTTYLVSANSSFNTLTAEGGAVLKYVSGKSLALNTLVCKSSSFRPTIFTCVDDDSVGESMAGYTTYYNNGTISPSGYANPAIQMSSLALNVTNCVFRYAQKAIQYPASSVSSATFTVSHSQLYNCIRGIDLTWAGCGSGSGSGVIAVSLNNTLFTRVQYPLYVTSLTLPVNPTLIHCTIDQATALVGGSGSVTFKSTNSIYANVTNSSGGSFSGSYNGFYLSTSTFGGSQFPCSSLPFQTVGLGNYYLTASSGLRNVGTTASVPSALLAAIARKTTFPPTILTSDFTSDTTLWQTAFRDTDIPDLGYHYDPIDYIWSGLNVQNNVTLTIGRGVSIANYGQLGTTLTSGAQLISEGSPVEMNHFLRYSAVQEQGILWGTTAGQNTDLFAPLTSSQARFRFTDFSMMEGIHSRYWNFATPSLSSQITFTDCSLRGGYLNINDGSSTINIALTNNLLQRCNFSLQFPVTLNLRNNLFFAGQQLGLLCNQPLAGWSAYDNLFDSVTLIQGSQTFPAAYNAYHGMGTTTIAGDTHPLSITTCDYQIGSLGEYYYPTNGTNIKTLIDLDSSTTPTQVGLYYYTTITNALSEESSSLLDVGMHYVGLDANGNPIDSNGDGIPDYMDSAPVIITQPQSQAVAGGANATFTVKAGGFMPLAYQWFHGAAAMAGATSATLSLSAVDLPDAGNYNVIVSNLKGSVTSATAALTVQKVASPTFSVLGGSYVTAQSVAISCTTPGAVIHYTLNGVIPTQSDPTYSSPITINQSQVTLSANGWKTGFATSDTEVEGYRIEATPSDIPPTITISPPTGTTLLASDDVNILVQASDSDGTVARIDLFQNGSKVATTSGGILQYTMSQAAAGTYNFTARAIDNVGFVTTSAPVTITVNASGPVVTLHGSQEYFSTPAASLIASVLGINPGSLSHLTLNGIAKPMQTGNFTLNANLVEGQNSFTLIATDNQSRTAQATTTIYLDSVPPRVTITAPATGSSFSTSRINVSGTFTDGAIKQIMVNGISAFITGTSWETLNVPLVVGANTITAIATDLAGNTGAAAITVSGTGSLVDPVQLIATPVGGFAPLQVNFQVQANVPGTLQQVLYDFDGNDTIDQTTVDLTPINHTYSTPGSYFPAVTVVSTAGRFSSIGGWNGSKQRQQINVQTPPSVVRTINVTDPIDLKWTSGGYLYVLSRSTATITEYDSTGATLRSLSGIGVTPKGLDVDSSGGVYVAVTGDNQIRKFKPVGSTFQADTTFNGSGFVGRADKSPGSGNGEFNSPFDVAITADGLNIAISDSGNNRVQVFTSSGQYLYVFGDLGTDLGQFNAPKGLAFDSMGVLYIVDSGNSRIALSELFGVVGISASAGTSLGQLQGPINLGAGSRGLYVADTGNNRIQKFDLAGHGDENPFTPLFAKLSISSEIGLNQPNAVSPEGNLTQERIYIADTANNRVLLVNLPTPGGSDPLTVWNSMQQRLLASDIPGALLYFSASSMSKYREAFLSIGTTDLLSDMSLIGSLTPVFIDNYSAEYRFDQIIQGYTITFLVDFVLENGIWKIESF